MDNLDDLVAKALVDRKDAIVSGLVAGAIESLQRDLGWRAASAATEAIDVFIKTEVLPALSANLISRKAEIIAALVAGVDASIATASLKLQEQAAKNLSQSWNVSKLAEAMFK